MQANKKEILDKVKKRLPMIVSVAVLLILAILVTVFLTKNIRNSIYSERQSSLQNITEASAKTVDTEMLALEDKSADFARMVEHMLMEDVSINSIIEDLNGIYDLGNDKFFLVDHDGRYFADDGKKGRVSDQTYYTNSSNDSLMYMGTLPHLMTDGTSNSEDNFIDNKVYIIYRTRLKTQYNKYIDGASGATANIEYASYMCDIGELNDIVSSLYGGKNNTFIYETSTGAMLYKQFDIGMLLEGYNIYHKMELVDFVNGENAADIIASCKDNKASVHEMQINGNSYYGCSAPLAQEDWSLYFVVPKDFVATASAKGFQEVAYSVAAIAVILAVIIFVLAIYMFANKNTREKLQSQKLIEEKQNELENALGLAEKASSAKTSFLFNLSHDIRTPMNAIIGFTNIAQKNLDDTEKVASCLEKTQKSSDVLLSLINDVLEMSRIESGEVKLSQDKVDIEKSLDSIMPMTEELADKKHIDLDYSFDIKNHYVIMDTLRTVRLCMNLISNALKYTEVGGMVRVNITEIECDKPGYATYRYTFKDNGIGMSDAFQTRLFDQFAREETIATRNIQGTGLGLALCKSLVTLMGGDISVDSRLGKGTTFTVVLTFKLTEKTAIEDEIATDADNDSLAGKKVLVVEDNMLNREIVREMLEDIGIDVDDAFDGINAVDKLKEVGPDYFDYILMDIQMPRMDGYGATREIRAMFPDKHIPIFALSANAFEEDKQKSIESGMDGHLAKPVVLNEITRLFKKYIKN